MTTTMSLRHDDQNLGKASDCSHEWTWVSLFFGVAECAEDVDEDDQHAVVASVHAPKARMAARRTRRW
jgi:hypothetical protein